MFRFIFKSANFEDSFSEAWTENKDLNPKRVDVLGYRDNASIIMDFVRAGRSLAEVRDGYTGDSEPLTDNYFEETSSSVDNLYNMQVELERRTSSKDSDGGLSTNPHEPTDKGKATVETVDNTTKSEDEKEESSD